jgi:hypothetical protein
MKNQYFGDINDYRKYGLLRALQPLGQGKLLVAWMLTPDDGSRDGGFRAYLQGSDRWRRYDPGLFDGLAILLRSQPMPDVSLIEKSSLLPNTAYYSAVVPDGRTDRDIWRRDLLDAARNVDLTFVDPDNGIQVPSKPVGRKGFAKYVAWEEVEGLWAAGCSVLIYQHFRREPGQRFAERMVTELRERTGARFAEAFRTPHVLFLLIVQERHELGARAAMSLLRQCWRDQITPSGLASRL